MERSDGTCRLLAYRGQGQMRDNLDFATIFPIKDAASAELMLKKAEHLFDAGIIDRSERQAVIALYLKTLMSRPTAVDP